MCPKYEILNETTYLLKPSGKSTLNDVKCKRMWMHVYVCDTSFVNVYMLTHMYLCFESFKMLMSS